MTSSKYISHGLDLTDGQLEKIIRASQNQLLCGFQRII